MGKYVVGLDGGGSKTALQIRNIEGKILLATQVGGLNFNSYTEKDLKGTIHEIVNLISNMEGGLEACELICISAAGISNPDAIKFLQHTFKDTGLYSEITCVGDYESALYGALGKSVGIILISGTGSICYGKNKDGHVYRTGGWGHIIDDEGSGFAIGRDILAVAVQSYDKRIPSSILYDMVLNKTSGESITDIIQYTYKSTIGKKDIAAFAPLLLEAIKKKDQQAIKISKKAAKALVELVIPVAHELGVEQGEIALTGGILTNYKDIRESVITQLKDRLPKLNIIETKYDSVSGATLMALEQVKKRREREWQTC